MARPENILSPVGLGKDLYMGRYTSRETKYLSLPCARIMRRGAAVFKSPVPKPRTDVIFHNSGGGRISGEVGENGINDPKLGRNLEDGMRFSCCSVAKRRKCRVR